ncbi:MAG: PAS domain S-box protein [Nitrospirae bacterium]|nr:MAG: PAS domain S-box protein [Nitrospirota bacterium]
MKAGAHDYIIKGNLKRLNPAVERELREAELRHERRLDKKKLIETSELLENIFSNIHILIAYMDTEFNFIRVNPLYALTDGRDPKFFVGKNHFELYPNKENEEIFRQVVATGESYFTYAKPFQYTEHQERGVTYWDWSLQPVMDNEENVHGLVLSLIDVTEKVKLQSEAMQSAHLASLGELAAGVAHEINNPLNGIINYAQILVNKMDKESRESEIARRIIKEGDRIANIVKSLLSFARKRTEEKSIYNISGILHDALLLTEAQILRDGIKLKVNMPEDLPEIFANSQQIQQVFLNVINNSRYALNQKYNEPDEDKILEISGSETVIDGQRHVRVIFHDKGSGIPAGVVDKVINPFFSTKPSGKGTGLGLSISHGIIEDHGGNLKIESVEGEFTEITIALPEAALRSGR